MNNSNTITISVDLSFKDGRGAALRYLEINPSADIVDAFEAGVEWSDKTAWKPSEEQMKALSEALSLAKNCGEEYAFDLRTLHEQLKKLKESKL